jgi:DNA-binding transcriptional LysR family regulator
MDDPLNWHDLEIFHAVLEHGSFSAAARALGMSQPTVSRHVESLERRLGRELFVRAPSGLAPSALAREMGQRTADMSEGMFGVQRLLDGQLKEPQGIVTLSLPYGFGGIVLMRALREFHDHYPDVSIDLRLGPLQSNLGRREADIDLRWLEPAEPEVISRRMGHWHFGLYATDHYLRRHGIPQRITDLNDHAFPLADDAVMEFIVEQLAEHGVQLRRFPFRCTGNLMLNTLMSAESCTMGLLPNGLHPPAMIRVLPEFHIASPAMWLTMHSALRRNTPIRAVWDWLQEHLPPVMQATRV